MSARSVSVPSRRIWQPSPAQVLVTLVAVGGCALLGRMATQPHLLRYAAAVVFALVVVAAGIVAPRKTLLALMIWLPAMGFVRRVLGTTGGNDPLLLVEPLILGTLLVAAAANGAFRGRTRLANAVAILTVLVLLGALNPLQGSVLAGVVGLLFMLVPMLGFWVGRGLVDDAMMKRIFVVVGTFAALGAIYGLFQTFFGFPSWDARWIAQAQARGYVALSVFTAAGQGTVVRPFASYSSAAEYVAFLGVGVVIWIAFARAIRLGLALAGVMLLGAAIIYGSSRTVVVAVIAACALMLGARRRYQMSLSIAAAAVLLLFVPFVAGLALPSVGGVGGAGTLISHQLEGLSNPLNPQASTAATHLSLILRGLRSAYHEPLGLGVSTVNLAGTRFGGTSSGSTEADPSNVAVALGLPGLAVYLALVAFAFGRAYLVAKTRRDGLALAAVGILAVTLFQWLTGGNYAVAVIPWLVLGWVDRQSSARDEGGRVDSSS